MIVVNKTNLTKVNDEEISIDKVNSIVLDTISVNQ